MLIRMSREGAIPVHMYEQDNRMVDDLFFSSLLFSIAKSFLDWTFFFLLLFALANFLVRVWRCIRCVSHYTLPFWQWHQRILELIRNCI